MSPVPFFMNARNSSCHILMNAPYGITVVALLSKFFVPPVLNGSCE
jgi:hypothetical protein